MFGNVTEHLITALICIVIFLAVAHCLVLLISFFNKEKDFSNLKLRMRSWWIITFFLMFIFVGSKPIQYCSVALLCFLALKEYFSFIKVDLSDRSLLFWAYLAIPVEMYFLYTNWVIMFYLFVPLYMFLLIPIRRILSGETHDFIRVTGLIQWGMLLTVYSLGFIGAFLMLPIISPSPYQFSGLEVLLYLLILNSLNDAFQYVWGKLFGKHKIVPTISPNKTWEGYIGGMLTTVVLAYVIAPYLTPFTWKYSVVSGLLISAFGFLGDVCMSAVKRDIGVKDSSTLIPGHGGVLDRVDSLIFTAPVFFHFFCYFFQHV